MADTGKFQLIKAKNRALVGRKFTASVNPHDATACAHLLEQKARALGKLPAEFLLIAYELGGRKTGEYSA